MKLTIEVNDGSMLGSSGKRVSMKFSLLIAGRRVVEYVLSNWACREIYNTKFFSISGGFQYDFETSRDFDTCAMRDQMIESFKKRALKFPAESSNYKIEVDL